MATIQDAVKPVPVEPSKFATIDAHPAVVVARDRGVDANARLTAAETSLAQAHAELTAAEDAAVERRDDRRLQKARTAVADAESDLRIATRGVAQAEDLLQQMREAVRAHVSATLRTRHRALAEELSEALDAARRISEQMAAAEDWATSQLFPAAMDAALRPELLAWRREFSPGGRLDLWRECGLGLAPVGGRRG